MISLDVEEVGAEFDGCEFDEDDREGAGGA